MIVKAVKSIKFPNSLGDWVTASVIGPHKGRVLLELRGHSGMSSWLCGLATFPEEVFSIQNPDEWSQEYTLLPGVYQIISGEDRRGKLIQKFYIYKINTDTDFVLFDAPGFLLPDISSPLTTVVLAGEGHSRTGKNGARWSLLAAPVGATVAIEPYDEIGDPIYYYITSEGPQAIGATDAVLPPEEW